MRISFAHLRERARAGGWVNFAVFGAKSNSGSQNDNARLLAELTAKARASSLQIDQSALAYRSGGRLQFFGNPPLVEYLSKSGLPGWTHSFDV